MVSTAGSKDHEESELASDLIDLSKFVQEYSSRLPVVICTRTGHHGNNEVEDISANQIFLASKIVKQIRLMTKMSSSDKFVSIPANSEHSFMTFDEFNKVNGVISMKEVISMEKQIPPLRIALNGDSKEKTYWIAGAEMTSEKIGTLTVLGAYNEHFIIVHRIGDNAVLKTKPLAFPFYVGVKIQAIHGQEDISTDDWRQLLISYKRELQAAKQHIPEELKYMFIYDKKHETSHPAIADDSHLTLSSYSQMYKGPWQRDEYVLDDFESRKLSHRDATNDEEISDHCSRPSKPFNIDEYDEYVNSNNDKNNNHLKNIDFNRRENRDKNLNIDKSSNNKLKQLDAQQKQLKQPKNKNLSVDKGYDAEASNDLFHSKYSEQNNSSLKNNSNSFSKKSLSLNDSSQSFSQLIQQRTKQPLQSSSKNEKINYNIDRKRNKPNQHYYLPQIKQRQPQSQQTQQPQQHSQQQQLQQQQQKLQQKPKQQTIKQQKGSFYTDDEYYNYSFLKGNCYSSADDVQKKNSESKKPSTKAQQQQNQWSGKQDADYENYFENETNQVSEYSEDDLNKFYRSQRPIKKEMDRLPPEERQFIHQTFDEYDDECVNSYEFLQNDDSVKQMPVTGEIFYNGQKLESSSPRQHPINDKYNNYRSAEKRNLIIISDHNESINELNHSKNKNFVDINNNIDIINNSNNNRSYTAMKPRQVQKYIMSDSEREPHNKIISSFEQPPQKNVNKQNIFPIQDLTYPQRFQHYFSDDSLHFSKNKNYNLEKTSESSRYMFIDDFSSDDDYDNYLQMQNERREQANTSKRSRRIRANQAVENPHNGLLIASDDGGKFNYPINPQNSLNKRVIYDNRSKSDFVDKSQMKSLQQQQRRRQQQQQQQQPQERQRVVSYSHTDTIYSFDAKKKHNKKKIVSETVVSKKNGSEENFEKIYNNPVQNRTLQKSNSETKSRYKLVDRSNFNFNIATIKNTIDPTSNNNTNYNDINFNYNADINSLKYVRRRDSQLVQMKNDRHPEMFRSANTTNNNLDLNKAPPFRNTGNNNIVGRNSHNVNIILEKDKPPLLVKELGFSLHAPSQQHMRPPQAHPQHHIRPSTQFQNTFHQPHHHQQQYSQSKLILPTPLHSSSTHYNNNHNHGHNNHHHQHFEKIYLMDKHGHITATNVPSTPSPRQHTTVYTTSQRNKLHYSNSANSLNNNMTSSSPYVIARHQRSNTEKFF